MWWNARALKLDWWLAGLVLLIVTSLSLTRCGGTGSDLVGFPEGDTFVNEGCGTDSTCLRLSISPSRIPADGVSTATFIATLFNADGSPAADEQVCFFVEDTAAATIIEPVGDNCQLTGGDGRVSGRVQAGTLPVSVRIVARSFSRSLETSVVLLLGEASLPEPAPAGLTLLPATASLDEGESIVLTARLRDSNNQPIAGATIVFSRSPAVGSLSASSAITGADGQASITYTAGAQVGTVVVTAQSGTLVDNSEITVSPPATPTPVPTPAGCAPLGVDCSGGRPCCEVSDGMGGTIALQCVFDGTNSTCQMP